MTIDGLGARADVPLGAEVAATPLPQATTRRATSSAARNIGSNPLVTGGLGHRLAPGSWHIVGPDPSPDQTIQAHLHVPAPPPEGTSAWPSVRSRWLISLNLGQILLVN